VSAGRRAGLSAVVLAAFLASCASKPPPPPVETPSPAATPPCPDEMALVQGRFCIDRWEASLVEIDGDRPFSPFASPTSARVRAVSKPGVVPQGYVSRDQAEAACEASGKRLCKEDEWVTACRGDPPHAYPYGDARRKGACNDAGISPLHVYYPEAPSTYMPGPMNDPRLNQTHDTVSKTGAFTECTNGYGVYDMVGNLHEWVMSSTGTFRGGYFQDTKINGEGCAYRTTAHAPAYHDYSTGFRCCADPRDATR
jgi:sulfatase modifying factor 1